MENDKLKKVLSEIVLAIYNGENDIKWVEYMLKKIGDIKIRKELCSDCKDLPEGVTIAGHDHRLE